MKVLKASSAVKINKTQGSISLFDIRQYIFDNLKFTGEDHK